MFTSDLSSQKIEHDIKTKITPLTEKDRIRIIDTIRGLAILGILLANIIVYAFPGWEGASVWIHAKTTSDYAFLYFVSIFISGKFFSIFSILFGFGLAIQNSRINLRDRKYQKIYRRRLIILFVIGIIHGIFLYPGDILAFYALIAAIAFLLKDKPAVYLKQVFISLIFFSVIILVVGFQLFPSLITASEPDWKSLADKRRIELKSQRMSETNDLQLGLYQTMSDDEQWHKQGPFWRLVLYQGIVYLVIGFPLRLLLVTWRCLPLFLIGMYLYKKGIFNRKGENRSIYKRWLISGLPVGVFLHLVAGGIQLSGVSNILTNFIMAGVITIGPLLMALGYIGLAALLSHFNWINRIYNAVAAVGRMALTNYLLQSVIAGILFNFYGLALYGELRPVSTLWFALVIFSMQMLISMIWLKYFKFGPVEWIWRKWTYNVPLTIRR